MRVFIVLSAVLACVVAKPALLHTPALLGYSYPAPVISYAAAAPVAVSSSQYHAQDALGQYSYGYTDGVSAKAESKSLDGVTRGGYSYIDAEGKVQHLQYIADPIHGFRVSGTNLPVAPKVPEVVLPESPKPVKDTPEVAEAKSKHLVAIEEAKTRNAAADIADAAEAAKPVVISEPIHAVAHPLPAVHALPYTYPIPALGVRPVGSFGYSINNYYHAPAYSPYRYGHLSYPYAGYAPAGLHH